jgi:membrane peptidoglycan carboxypeptidase
VIIIKNKIKILIKYLFILFIIIIILYAIVYIYSFLSPKTPIKNNGKFYIYDKYNKLIYQGSSSSTWVNYENINQNMINAIINTEDKNFYKHKGFDYYRIIGAIYKNIKYKKVVEGASTISQQYVKNMYLSFDKTWNRKLEEAFLTLKIESHYTKREILEGYLNTINFGEGNYGIYDAAKYYFNKSPSQLNIEESCILAGIPKSPSNYNPISNYDKSIKRAKLIAKILYKNKIITYKKYKTLFKSKINLYGKKDKNNLKTLMYYQDAVLKELNNIKTLPKDLIKTGGIKIYTEYDNNIQENIESSINEHMKEDNTQIASIYIDPKSGGINALIGGKNYEKSQYNRVTQSKRQVGSTIKPFLYYTALNNGLLMNSKFKSEPTIFNIDNKKTYSPSNYNDVYANDDITMSLALAYSDNIYAVKTHLFLGEEKLVNTLKEFGLQEKLDKLPSLALGTKEINMLDYARAYTVLASGGYKKNIHIIRKIETNEGKQIYKYKNYNQMITNYNNLFILNSMLKNTYNQEYILYNNPTAISIKGRLTHNYAIKTGTTNDDHWTIGYNKKGLLMVWTGKDSNNNKDDEIGYSKITKNIWADSMEKTQKNVNNEWYEQPSNVIGIPTNPISGNIDNNSKTIFYFVKGTEPQN